MGKIFSKTITNDISGEIDGMEKEIECGKEKTLENDATIHTEKSLGYFTIKRVIDIVGASVGIILLSPAFLVTALAIKIDTKGPIFYVQDRVGKNGKLFRMFKFRSMIVNAEDLLENLRGQNEMSGPMFKINDDPRITRLGRFIRKTSIDELPQIYNVLRGEMALVGPRPNLPDEVAKFSEYQRKKIRVKPGLTCYWQVMGRSSIGFEDWMGMDIKYIEDRNTVVDLMLILKTFKVFLGDKNAK